MKISVVEDFNFTPSQKARLETLGKVIYFSGVPDDEELGKRSEEADILAVNWAPLDTGVSHISKSVNLISIPFTGVGWIPIKEYTARGIKIANSPGYSTEAVAEFGMGLMLSIVRNIPSYVKGEPKVETTPTLYGKNLVILGAGRIASQVGIIAKSLGMKVIYWKRGDNLIKAIKEADILYSALPFSDETKDLLKESEFRAMKKSSYFVTTSHNQIYDHNALLKALDHNLAGAGLDLEGTNTGDYKAEAYLKLKSHPKVLLTPHIAYKTDYALMKGNDIMIDNIEAFVKGKPTHIVN